MKLKKLITLVASCFAFSSGAVLAEPFYIDVNSWDPAPNASTVIGTDGNTDLMTQMQINWNATSTYTDLDANGVDAGDTVVDSGLGTVGGFLLNGVNLSGFEATEGLAGFYDINFEYTDLTGTVLAVGPDPSDILASYTSGTINIYGDFDADGVIDQDVLLMTIDVFASGGELANFLIFGTVSFVRDDTFFFPVSTDWADVTIAIQARVDTNVDKGEAPAPTGNPNEFARTTELNGSVEFNRVPEPASIALLGLGLLGLGFSRRFRKAA